MPKNKFNQGGKTYTLKTTKHCRKNFKDLVKWKDIIYTWIRRLNIAKISTLPKRSTNSVQALSKFRRLFFV